MGEKIKNLSVAEIGSKKLCIELNESQSDLKGYDIHVECSPFRFAVKDDDYMKFANAVLEARKKITYTKKTKEKY